MTFLAINSERLQKSASEDHTTDYWRDWHQERPRQNRLSLHCPVTLDTGSMPWHPPPPPQRRKKGLLVTKWLKKRTRRQAVSKAFLRSYASLLAVQWFYRQVLAAWEDRRTRLQASHRATAYLNIDLIHWPSVPNLQTKLFVTSSGKYLLSCTFSTQQWVTCL